MKEGRDARLVSLTTRLNDGVSKARPGGGGVPGAIHHRDGTAERTRAATRRRTKISPPRAERVGMFSGGGAGVITRISAPLGTLRRTGRSFGAGSRALANEGPPRTARDVERVFLIEGARLPSGWGPFDRISRPVFARRVRCAVYGRTVSTRPAFPAERSDNAAAE